MIGAALSTTDIVVIIGAVLGGIGGIVTAWSALVKARREGSDDCEARVKSLREENETMAAELHRLRLERQ